ncbi:hypothetical protein JJC03_07585 [Flavobacterium oreochromis]|uniref:hypothetical protein n=1 Tax=Flavobacterium oreochromis TaxID=2906078 RepID=UPI001CE62E53|nr:hypothetical protein [Flavobacterium oreochromis]QYS87651.1 hypothetical protein JJC03_07585 [Flavobacterium oreochromis]
MRKNIYLLFLIFTFTTFIAQVNPNYNSVRGYYKSNGTYVEPYNRTNPNNTNTDNYSTRPNINPWTGKRGTITPDYEYNTKTNYNYSNNNNSNTNTYKELNSSVSVYSNYGESGYIKIWIDGVYAGYLESHFKTGTPNCGQDGTIKLPITSGSHSYIAKDNAGFKWSGNFNTSPNSCFSLGLNTSAERRFELGKINAKENYQIPFLNYVVPFTMTALDLQLGAVTTLTIDLFPPSINKSGDKNFDKGYRRIARKKKIITTLISFGLGALTNIGLKEATKRPNQ